MSEKTKKCILIKTCCFGGRHYPPGDTIYDWPKVIVDELVEKEGAEPVLNIESNTDNTRSEKIIFAAQDAIDNGDINKDESPKVEAMEEILGFEITVEERDIAWETLKKEWESN